MADLREIKAVKTQMRLEKVALDAQIRQALLASEALANQVRAMHELQAAQAAQAQAAGDNGEGKRGGKAVQAFSRWLSGRG